MDIELDPLSPVPIYQQIRDRIVEGIARGQLRDGSLLASVRELSAAFAINPATVVKAYDLLRRDGFVRTSRRSGSVIARDGGSEVREETFTDWQGRMLTLLAEARANGFDADRILSECRGLLDGFAAHQPKVEGES
ncbi:GntR family transcriptional regulator [Leekyejoonella antrihumi]|uniref:GntR family transcriptional regulator n=1 Tax=Leekyejoonella antrihumi TaxID=1660198 RepID=A0A563E3N4_9MICO|nr:GntR family transcriptional regulator [Leekyejoonella antrihumi]TWP36919.1 GntR family transcriptional regulator [Leekyejoonella antrihumi]